jgi:hypothetical protein
MISQLRSRLNPLSGEECQVLEEPDPDPRNYLHTYLQMGILYITVCGMHWNQCKTFDLARLYRIAISFLKQFTTETRRRYAVVELRSVTRA